ncbi:uncharacterized protein LOC125386761 [Bombus terrestris]|uniref:Uncharacterized protein LOC125386761 n=1 Tax=Bombus terrestris TaxID=30195 RepID=A0A9C6SIW9_BOMTE|nr:uncharacterized protein LOC125386761 [Bombus terrestris]
MGAFYYAKKRPASSSDNSSAGPEAKRHKPFDSRNRCYHCRNYGHKAPECRKRIKSEAEKYREKPIGHIVEGELIKANIVRPSNSSYASPMLLVKKKDGSDRLCVDFRELNKNTVADRYPLPLTPDQIARLQQARYLTSLDMTTGFHQIPIHPNSTEYTTASPTSEVGSKDLLRAMKRQMDFMRDVFHTLTKKDGVELEKFSLPFFNPELAGADPMGWCETVSKLMGNEPLQDRELFFVLNRAMGGFASQWLTQVPVCGLTWERFKEYFLSHYDGKETATSTLIKVFEEPPEEDEPTVNFGIRFRSLLAARWSGISNAELINAVILLRLTSYDQRVERIALTQDVRTQDQFLRELRALPRSRKRPLPLADDLPTEPETKRSRPSNSQTRCYHCGTPGHKAMECRKKMRTEKQKETRRREWSRPATSSKVFCLRCRADGHIAPNCLLREDKKSGHNKERRVDSCVVEAPTGKLSHQGESFPFCFDSGAECSLIMESAASKFSGKRTTDVVVMRGIGNTCVKSTSQILSTVCINGFTLEITFHVLPDKYLKYDIKIGREILSRGFDVHITRTSLDICKTKVVNVCDRTVEKEIDLNEVDTEVIGSDKGRLISILEKFKNSFITGFPRTRVNTGQLEIRLIDLNVTVQRSPYRLSEEERRTGRERIGELIKANIIRPSNSPFASPMMLVKKKNGSNRLSVDFRALNKNTVADRYPLPLIADQIARLQNAKYFISLDMASGFHQIPIHPNSTVYTAFVTPDRQYEYVTMPFGLKNAPSVFQRAILNALGDLAHSYVVVYLDDVLIIADSVDQALERLNNVLDTLVKAGFSFNFAKCSFLRTSVLYLGYIIHNGEVRPNPGKIHALSSLPAPTMVTQFRQFIGLASYFRKFVPKFSQTMKPLYALTSGSKNITWSDRHENDLDA